VLQQTLLTRAPEDAVSVFEFTETHQQIGEMLRRFCEREIEPVIDGLERGEVDPFSLLRRLSDTFGLGEMVEGPLRRKAERLRAGEPPAHTRIRGL
jgi:hypothetical protein